MQFTVEIDEMGMRRKRQIFNTQIISEQVLIITISTVTVKGVQGAIFHGYTLPQTG